MFCSHVDTNLALIQSIILDFYSTNLSLIALTVMQLLVYIFYDMLRSVVNKILYLLPLRGRLPNIAGSPYWNYMYSNLIWQKLSSTKLEVQ